ncbi:YwaF family protein [Paenibacillus sp. y28]|uniref:YwaF family protein n=1 Tax=Paenibacillus sp. y28 TaxID=3129110 RepID=UPI003017D9F5
MDSWITAALGSERFELFSLSHGLAMGFTIAGILLLFLFRDRLQEKRAAQLCRWFIAVVLVVTEVALQVWGTSTQEWNAAEWLPFQLCSLSLMLCVYMLLMKSRRVYEFVYFTGIGGAAMAILTPALSYPFPHFRFWHFFIAHAFIMFACFFATWVMKFRPTLRSVGTTILFLNGYLLFVFGVNAVTGGNYMFVSQKPSQGGLMDALGDYPWYLLSLEGIAVVLFLLMYVPFWIGAKSGLGNAAQSQIVTKQD